MILLYTLSYLLRFEFDSYINALLYSLELVDDVQTGQPDVRNTRLVVFCPLESTFSFRNVRNNYGFCVQLDVDVATHISVTRDGPRRYLTGSL